MHTSERLGCGHPRSHSQTLHPLYKAWTVGICLLANSRYTLMLQMGWLLPQLTRYCNTGGMFLAQENTNIQGRLARKHNTHTN